MASHSSGGMGDILAAHVHVCHAETVAVGRATLAGMMTVLPDLPTGVVGIEASGTLRAEDYRDVLLPAIQAGARAGDLRVMIVIPGFDGITPGAMWQDL